MFLTLIGLIGILSDDIINILPRNWRIYKDVDDIGSLINETKSSIDKAKNRRIIVKDVKYSNSKNISSLFQDPDSSKYTITYYDLITSYIGVVNASNLS
jgi:hypothetical protein